jgi:thiol-disulfide isomerase/thioredoxin
MFTSNNALQSIALALFSALATNAGAEPTFPVTIETTTGDHAKIPDPDARATVLAFLSADCPVANRYAPELVHLEEEYAKKAITFLRVYPDPFQEETAITKHTDVYDYTFPAIHDTDHTLVKRAGVKVTPEVAVILPNGSVLYHGRIDNRYADFGKYRQEATREDLREVLDALIDGSTPEPRTTKAIGCFIPDLPKENRTAHAANDGE